MRRLGQVNLVVLILIAIGAIILISQAPNLTGQAFFVGEPPQDDQPIQELEFKGAGNPGGVNPSSPATNAHCGMTVNSNLVLDGDLNCPAGTPGLIIGTNGITLDCNNHIIQGSGAVGISLLDRSDVTVKNCVVQGGFNIYSGFTPYTDAWNNNLILNNTVLNAYLGIELKYDRGTRVVNNTVISNHMGGSCGVYVYICDGVQVINNSVSDNWYGLSIYNMNHDITIEDNTLFSNNQRGIEILDICNQQGCGNSSDIAVSDNVIKDNGQGIFVDSTDNNVQVHYNKLYNNTVPGAFGSGDLVSYGTNSGFTNNYFGGSKCVKPTSGTLTRAAASPFYVDAAMTITSSNLVCCGDTLTGNTVLDYGLESSGSCLTIGANSISLNCQNKVVTGAYSGTGINLNNYGSANIQNCTVLKFQNGISFSNSNSNYLSNNTVNNNSQYGMYFTDSDRSYIYNNKVQYNTEAGVRIESGSFMNNFTSGRYGFSKYGFRIVNSQNNVINKTLVNYNSLIGIWGASVDNTQLLTVTYQVTPPAKTFQMDPSSGIQIIDNTIDGPCDVGGELIDITNSVISGNNFTDCTQYALKLSGSATNTLSNNNFANAGINSILFTDISNANAVSNTNACPTGINWTTDSAGNTIQSTTCAAVYTPPPINCGNGQIEPGESCDGANLQGMTCQDRGYLGGTLACSQGCMTFDTSACAATLACGSTITSDIKLIDGLSSCTDRGIIIGADNVTLDCSGYTINGAGASNSFGIYVNGHSGVTIKNCTLTNFHYGIRLESSPYNTLTGNTIIGFDPYLFSASGVYLVASSYNILSGNNIHTSLIYGINVDSNSHYNNLTENVLETANPYRNAYGINVRSGHNTLIGNTAFNNWAGIYLGGASNNVLINNNVSSNTGGYGLELFNGCNYNTIVGTIADNNRWGLWIYNSVYNNVTGNTAHYNTEYGLSFFTSSNNTVNNNNACGNTNEDIYLKPDSSSNVGDNACVGPGGNTAGNPGLTCTQPCFETCGNNQIEDGEICDGTDLGSSCQSLGFSSGILACKASCANFDTSGCVHEPVLVTSCGDLNQSQTLYLLQNNLSGAPGGTCFSVKANNITLDCQGYTLTGPGYWNGITMDSPYMNNIVQNCTITNYGSGIFLLSSDSHNIIRGNTIFGMINTGIDIQGSSSNTITNNTVVDGNYSGIYLAYSTNNNIFDNRVCNNIGNAVHQDIYIYPSSTTANTGDNVCDGLVGNTSANPGLTCSYDCAGNSHSVCGDGIKGGLEACDSDTVSCTAQGGYIGTKTCLSDCTDYSPCTTSDFCGDGNITVPEVCDINGSLGCSGSTPVCDNCASCIPTPPGCGNGQIDPGETCDTNGDINCSGSTPVCDSCNSCIALNANCQQTLTANLTLNGNLGPCGTGFRIDTSGVTLDCQGHSITGNYKQDDGHGVYISSNAVGVTVKNCVVKGFMQGGIYQESGTNNANILNNTVMFCGNGITTYSNNNIISGNLACNNGNDIYTVYASSNSGDNICKGPTFYPNQGSNTITCSQGCPFTQGVCGQVITSSVTLTKDITDCLQTGIRTAASNIVLDCAGHKITGIADYVYATGVQIDSDYQLNGNNYKYSHVTVKNCVVSGFGYGIQGSQMQDNLFTNNTVVNNNNGIRVANSGNTNTLINNNFVCFNRLSDIYAENGPAGDNICNSSKSYFDSTPVTCALGDCPPAPVCANNQLELGEICDATAAPNGCPSARPVCDQCNRCIQQPTEITGCVNVTQRGAYLVLQNDIPQASGSWSGCINIGASDVTLDCNGLTITGPGSGIGVRAYGYSGITVKNCTITNFEGGIAIDSNSAGGGNQVPSYNPNNVINNNVSYNKQFGIEVTTSYYSNIINNTVNNHGQGGIRVAYSGNGSIINNTANNNVQQYGFYLDSANDNNLTNNTAKGNYYGFYAYNAYRSRLSNNTFVDNNQYGMYIQNSYNTNVTDNLACFNTNRDVYIDWSSSSSTGSNICNSIDPDGSSVNCRPGCPASPPPKEISGCTVLGTQGRTYLLTQDFVNNYGPYYCMDVQANNVTLDCQGHSITGPNNWGYGVNVQSRNNFTVKNCIITKFSYGLYAYNTPYVSVTNSTVSNNENGIQLNYQNQNSIIANNTVLDNRNQGIYIGYNGGNSVVSGNTVCYSQTNIYIDSSSSTSTGSNFCDTSSNYFDGSSVSCDLGACPLPPPKEITNCQSLTTQGRLYLLTSNITSSSNCFNVRQNDIVLDCQGRSIRGNGVGSGYGVQASSRSNVTVKNCNISNFDYGVQFQSVSNGQIGPNIVCANNKDIYVDSGSNVGDNVCDANSSVFDGSSVTCNVNCPEFTVPQVQFVSPTPNNGAIVGIMTISVQADAIDLQTGIKSCWINFDGVIQPMTVVNDPSYGTKKVRCTISEANLSLGQHTFQAFANDSVGNIGQTEQRTITINNTAIPITSCQYFYNGGVYELQNDIPNVQQWPCFGIQASYVVLDCKGHSLTTTSPGNYRGIEIGNNLGGITVKNCNISNLYEGIIINNQASNNELINNTVCSNAYNDIYIGGNTFQNVGTNNACRAKVDYGTNPGFDECVAGCPLPPPTEINSCQSLGTKGAIYSLTQNITDNGNDPCFYISNDLITIDCNGHKVTSSNQHSWMGVYASWRTNPAINNCTFTNFDRGVYFSYTTNGKITNSTFYDNNRGMQLEYTANAIISNNIINNNTQEGIQVYEFYNKGSKFTDNLMCSNGGVDFFLSSGTRNNTGTNNTCLLKDDSGQNPGLAACVPGCPVSPPVEINSCQQLITKAGTYLLTQNITDGNTYYCFEARAKGITLDCQGHSITRTNNNKWGLGVYADSYYAKGLTVKNCTFTNFQYGILLQSSSASYNIIYNTLIGNSYGLDLSSVTQATINYNKIFNNTDADIYSDNSNTNNLTYNYWGGYICNAKIQGMSKSELAPYYLDEAMTTVDPGPVDCPVTCNDYIAKSVTLTSDLYCSNSRGLTVTANDVTIDCNGHTLSSSGGNYGIYAQSRSNVIVKNCILTNWDAGIFFSSVNGGTVLNNTMRNCGSYGYYHGSSSAINVLNNSIYNNNYYGIYFSGNNPSTFNYNKVYNNGNKDMYVSYTNNDLFTKNYWGGYICNAKVQGIDKNKLAPYYADEAMTTLTPGPVDCPIACNDYISKSATLTSDLNCPSGDAITITGDNLVFDCDGHKITGSGGSTGIYASSRSNITIKNCIITRFDNDIYFYSVAKGNVINNTATMAQSNGLRIAYSSNNNIINNSFSGKYYAGMDIREYSTKNNVTNNYAFSDRGVGMLIQYYSTNNIFINNTGVSSNVYNCNHGECGGIFFGKYCNNNQLINNTGKSINGYGIRLSQDSNNNLTGNVAYSENKYGIYLRTNENGNVLSNNFACWSGQYNIYLDSSTYSNTGDNTCDNLQNSGSNTVTCTTNCSARPPVDDLFSCRTFTASNRAYVVTNDIAAGTDSSYCFSVQANNITIDCQGHTITAPYTYTWGFGARVSGYSDFTLKNCKFVGFERGISVESSSNSKLINNSVSQNYMGIYVSSSSNTKVTNNLACTNSYRDVYVDWSSSSSTGNNICDNIDPDGSTVTCIHNCTWVPPIPICGDGEVNQPNEVCDSDTIACKTPQNYNGNKSCFSDCSGYSDCATTEFCGDNVTNDDELCDGNYQSCKDLAGYKGIQYCNSSCNGWGICEATESCGDGVINDGELCDGTNLNGHTCKTQNYTAGTLACNGNCMTFDVSGCYNDTIRPTVISTNPVNSQMNVSLNTPYIDVRFSERIDQARFNLTKDVQINPPINILSSQWINIDNLTILRLWIMGTPLQQSTTYTVTLNPHITPTETICNDLIDNDEDGQTDCADSDCAGNPACALTASRFTGTITINGVPVPQGIPMTARIGPAVCGSAVVGANGAYTIDVNGTDAVPGCGTNGATIVFRISSSNAGQTGIFQSGAVTTLQLTVGCVDSDGGTNYTTFGIATGTNGAVSDRCMDPLQIVEAVCQSSTAVSLMPVPCNNYLPGSVCATGVCVMPSATCSDTDGGDNPLVAGTATGTNGVFSDRCVSGPVIASNNIANVITQLEEQSCNIMNNQVQHALVDCVSRYGAGWSCSNNQCSNAPTTIADLAGNAMYKYEWSFTTETLCGNNVAEGSEVCDGFDLKGESCESQGYTGGTLGCALACNAFDTSSCYTDNVAPIITDNWTHNKVWINFDASIDLTVTDPEPSSGVAWLRYCIDNTGTCIPSIDYTDTITISTEGVSYLIYSAADNAGNHAGVSALTIKIDKSAPIITSATVTPDLVGTAATIEITKTVEDTYSGVSRVDAGIRDANGTNVDKFPLVFNSADGTWSGTYTFGAAADGTYYVYDIGYDVAGNQFLETDGSVLLDRTGPIVAITSITPQYNKPGDTVTIITEASDATSGFASQNSVVAIDTATGLTANLNSFTGSLLPGQVGTWTFTQATALPEGNHTETVTATDKAENIATASAQFFVDNTAPTSTKIVHGTLGNDNWYVSEVIADLTAVDLPVGGSGVAQVCINAVPAGSTCVPESGTCAPDTASAFINLDGTYDVCHNSIDNVGNTEATQYQQIKKDVESPTTTKTESGTVGNNGWFTSAVEITLAAIDATSGVAYSEYSFDNVMFTPYSAGPFIISTEGSTTVYYRSVDVAGNVEDIQSQVEKVDTIMPVTTVSAVTLPDYNAYVFGTYTGKDVEVTLTCSDDTSSCDQKLYCVATSACAPTTAYTGPITITEEGIFYVCFNSVDVAGNSDTVACEQVWVDKSAPSITNAVVTPDLVGTAATITITKTVEDTYSGVASVTATILDSSNSPVGTVALTQSGGDWGGTFTFGAEADGTYTVTDTATDAVGNAVTQTDGSVLLDRTGSTVVITSITPQYSKPGDTVTIITEASDATSGFASQSSVTAIDTTTGTPATLSSFAGSLLPGQVGTWTFTQTSTLPENVHTETVTATDKANNVATASGTFIVDNTAPTTTKTLIDSDGDGFANAFTLSATDALSGVNVTYYSLDSGVYVAYTGQVTITEGTHTISYYSVDNVGNVEVTKTQTDNGDYCPDVTGFKAPTEYVLEVQDFKSTASTVTAKRVFAGNTEVFVSGDGKYHIPLKDSSGNFIDDNTNYNTLPKGVWVVDRQGAVEATGMGTSCAGGGSGGHGCYDNMKNAGVIVTGVKGDGLPTGTYVYYKAKATLDGSVVVRNSAAQKFEKQGDGIATKGNTNQDEFTVTTATGITEILAEASVRPSSDYMKISFYDLQGCPYGDITTATMHIVDQKKSGVCGYGSNGRAKETCEKPLEGMVVKVYDRYDTAFKSAYGSNPNKNLYDNIFEADTGLVGGCTTAADGACLAPEEYGGKFIVIGKYVDTANDITIYQARLKNFKVKDCNNNEWDCEGSCKDEEQDDSDSVTMGENELVKTKNLRIVKIISKYGSVKYEAGNRMIIIGSELNVITADYVVWDNSKELYPFIMTSDSNWTVDVCLSVPEGYVIAGVMDIDGNVLSTTECLQTFIEGESKVILFELASDGTSVSYAENAPDVGISLKGTPEGEAQKQTTEDIEGVTKSESYTKPQQIVAPTQTHTIVTSPTPARSTLLAQATPAISIVPTLTKTSQTTILLIAGALIAAIAGVLLWSRKKKAGNASAAPLVVIVAALALMGIYGFGGTTGLSVANFTSEGVESTFLVAIGILAIVAYIVMRKMKLLGKKRR